jgi:hypothetical protein
MLDKLKNLQESKTDSDALNSSTGNGKAPGGDMFGMMMMMMAMGGGGDGSMMPLMMMMMMQGR